MPKTPEFDMAITDYFISVADALQKIAEYAKKMRDQEPFHSGIWIYLDGQCDGLQFATDKIREMAALTQDRSVKEYDA